MNCNKGQDIVLIASAAAIAIGEGKSSEEQALLGNLFNLIGDGLSVMSSKQDLCDTSSKKDSSDTSSKENTSDTSSKKDPSDKPSKQDSPDTSSKQDASGSSIKIVKYH